MGEYAKRKSDNQKIKIGTCQTMYYLRLEGRNQVEPIANNIDPDEYIHNYSEVEL